MADTLAMVAEVLAAAKEPWWVIAGAAVALHRPGLVAPADVDVLLGEGDARALLTRLAIGNIAGDGSPLFRSAVYARWNAPPLPVEFMAGFHVRSAAGWHAVVPRTRERVDLPGGAVFVPATNELAALLRAFGRSKDLARAAILAPGEGQSPSTS